MDGRRRFYLVGGRPVRTKGVVASTRTHVAFAADEDGVFWPVCGTPVGERDELAVGVFEELRRLATCRGCRRTREPMLPRPGAVEDQARRRWV